MSHRRVMTARKGGGSYMIYPPSDPTPKAPAAPHAKSCNGCTLCCKLLSVVLPDGERKEDATWCKHCASSGCEIYPGRPEGCKTFTCLWLSDPRISDDLWPKRSKVVLWTGNIDAHHKATLKPRKISVLMVSVDAGYPTRYKEQPTKGVIDTALSNGMPVVILIGKERKLIWPENLGHLAAGSTPGQTAMSLSHGSKVGQPHGL